MPMPLVAVTADLRRIGTLPTHLTPATYVDAVVDVVGAIPLILPNLGERLDIPALLDRVDGILVTGSPSNVHPARYGVAETEAHGPFDPERDETTLPLIRAALAEGVPLFCICRGHQELNVALGGTLDTEIQTLPGRDDHRSPGTDRSATNYAIRQPLKIEGDGKVAEILGQGAVTVNSLHRQAIGRLAPGLKVEATAPDGTIEAVSVENARAFAIGVQWHPEYWAREDAPSRALFEAFALEVRARAALRS